MVSAVKMVTRGLDRTRCKPKQLVRGPEPQSFGPKESGHENRGPRALSIAGPRANRWLDPVVKGRVANEPGSTKPVVFGGFEVGSVFAAEAAVESVTERPPELRPGPGELGRSGQELTTVDLWAVQEGLQALSAAMVLLDASGRLVFANHVARTLLEKADGIAVDPSNVVRCQDRQAQKELRRLLDQGLDERRDLDGAEPATLAIRRKRGLPLVALVVSQPDRSSAAAADRRTVLLLRDPERDLGVASDQLVALFGVSGAEADVVSRLAGGTSLEQIADERDVSLITVRNQLKSALGKFGVSRQVELVSIVLRSIQF